MSERKIPMRRCMGCREHKPKRELCRVVRSPEGEVSLDIAGKKPGRGVYVCMNAACFARVRKARALEKALSAAISDAVYEQIQALMEGNEH